MQVLDVNDVIEQEEVVDRQRAAAAWQENEIALAERFMQDNNVADTTEDHHPSESDDSISNSSASSGDSCFNGLELGEEGVVDKTPISTIALLNGKNKDEMKLFLAELEEEQNELSGATRGLFDCSIQAEAEHRVFLL